VPRSAAELRAEITLPPYCLGSQPLAQLFDLSASNVAFNHAAGDDGDTGVLDLRTEVVIYHPLLHSSKWHRGMT
jgi:hypothetical protein